MAASNSSQLVKLKIQSKDNSGAEPYEVFLNPSSINYSININYTNDQGSGGGTAGAPPPAAGSTGGQLGYSHTGPGRLSFSLDIDGTGATGEKKDVADEIWKFKKLTLEYKGDKHEPLVVIIVWGTLDMECRLQSLDINYTLFDPNGNPLRAKMNVAFVATIDREEEERRKNNQSPTCHTS